MYCETPDEDELDYALVYPITAVMVVGSAPAADEYFHSLDEMLLSFKSAIMRTVEETDRDIVPRGECPDFVRNMFGRQVQMIYEFEDTHEAAVTIDAQFHMPIAFETRLQ